MKQFFITIFFVSFLGNLISQQNILAFKSAYGLQLPYADLSQRYGANLDVSVGLEFQKGNGLSLGIAWAFLFGNNVKYDALKTFREPTGILIGVDGLASDVYYRSRGQQLGLDVSYNLGKDKSGLVFGGGLGILTYYTAVVDDSRSFEQVLGKYQSLYTLKAIGPYVKPLLGYHYKSSSGLINGKILFETTLSLTKFSQDSPYNEFLANKSTFADHSFGIKLVWLLPLRKYGETTVKYF
ncbi:MAG: hypothetical protein IPN72_18550 [Saprospiraceae bacterium]|nr:hypothetical protein [Saprospiraceae bacterium]